MIDFGILALFVVQLSIVLGSVYVLVMLRAEIKTLEGLQSEAKGLNPKVEGLSRDVEAVRRRQDEVDAAPKALLGRIKEVQEDLGKTDRELAKLDSKVATVIGRVGAISRGRKSEKVESEELDPASQDEGDGLTAYPPGSQQEPPHNQVIPPGFGKSARRYG